MYHSSLTNYDDVTKHKDINSFIVEIKQFYFTEIRKDKKYIYVS